MIEVRVTHINSVEGGEPRLMDARTSREVWLVPVIYELADGYQVEYHAKVHGSEATAKQWMHTLPIVPAYPMRCVFNEANELVNVVTRMVPEPVPA